MLAMLRTSRRFLAGAFGLLVLTSWLSVAAAACLSDGVTDPAGMAHHAMQSSAPQSSAMADCPHCPAVEKSCMDDRGDCDLPDVIVSQQHDQPQFLALPLADTGTPVVVAAAPGKTMHAIPPPRSGRALHILNCSFQE